MGLLTVTLGSNQHVAGLGITLVLIAACEFTFRVGYGGERPRLARQVPRAASTAPTSSDQYGLTYVGFLVLAPVAVVGAALDRHRLPAACGR